LFFKTASVTFAPNASARVIVSGVPVNTSVQLGESRSWPPALVRRHYLATRYGIVPLMARLRWDRIVPVGSHRIWARRFRHDPRLRAPLEHDDLGHGATRPPKRTRLNRSKILQDGGV
jgi:hypothetical protein